MAPLDLDLLRVFDHLHRERHLTRAARLLGLSQPAVSRALTRLRDALGDPLFVRAPRGIVPTPRADALAPDIREILRRTTALTQPEALVPALLERTFVLASVDLLEAELLPRLAGLLAKEAPRVSITSRPVGPDPSEALATGRVDLVVGVRPNIPADAMSTHLFEDDFVCVARAGHPTVKKRLTLDRYTSLSHVLISPAGTPGSVVDEALAKQGLSRRIAVRTHTFLAAPRVVASTDFILTGPRRVLTAMARVDGLQLLEPPVTLRSFAVLMAWHPRVQSDAVHSWLRDAMRRAAGGRERAPRRSRA